MPSGSGYNFMGGTMAKTLGQTLTENMLEHEEIKLRLREGIVNVFDKNLDGNNPAHLMLAAQVLMEVSAGFLGMHCNEAQQSFFADEFQQHAGQIRAAKMARMN